MVPPPSSFHHSASAVYDAPSFLLQHRHRRHQHNHLNNATTTATAEEESASKVRRAASSLEIRRVDTSLFATLPKQVDSNNNGTNNDRMDGIRSSSIGRTVPSTDGQRTYNKQDGTQQENQQQQQPQSPHTRRQIRSGTRRNSTSHGSSAGVTLSTYCCEHASIVTETTDETIASSSVATHDSTTQHHRISRTSKLRQALKEPTAASPIMMVGKKYEKGGGTHNNNNVVVKGLPGIPNLSGSPTTIQHLNNDNENGNGNNNNAAGDDEGVGEDLSKSAASIMKKYTSDTYRRPSMSLQDRKDRRRARSMSRSRPPGDRTVAAVAAVVDTVASTPTTTTTTTTTTTVRATPRRSQRSSSQEGTTSTSTVGTTPQHRPLRPTSQDRITSTSTTSTTTSSPRSRNRKTTSPATALHSSMLCPSSVPLSRDQQQISRSVSASPMRTNTTPSHRSSSATRERISRDRMMMTTTAAAGTTNTSRPAPSSTQPTRSSSTEPRRKTSIEPKRSSSTEPRRVSSIEPNKRPSSTERKRSSSSEGKRSSSTEGKRLSSTEGKRSSSTEGKRSSSTEGKRSSSTEGKRSSSTEGKRSSSTEGKRSSSTEGKRPLSAERKRASSTERKRASSTERRRSVVRDRRVWVSPLTGQSQQDKPTTTTVPRNARSGTTEDHRGRSWSPRSARYGVSMKKEDPPNGTKLSSASSHRFSRSTSRCRLTDNKQRDDETKQRVNHTTSNTYHDTTKELMELLSSSNANDSTNNSTKRVSTKSKKMTLPVKARTVLNDATADLTDGPSVPSMFRAAMKYDATNKKVATNKKSSTTTTTTAVNTPKTDFDVADNTKEKSKTKSSSSSDAAKIKNRKSTAVNQVAQRGVPERSIPTRKGQGFLDDGSDHSSNDDFRASTDFFGEEDDDDDDNDDPGSKPNNLSQQKSSDLFKIVHPRTKEHRTGGVPTSKEKKDRFHDSTGALPKHLFREESRDRNDSGAFAVISVDSDDLSCVSSICSEQTDASEQSLVSKSENAHDTAISDAKSVRTYQSDIVRRKDRSSSAPNDANEPSTPKSCPGQRRLRVSTNFRGGINTKQRILDEDNANYMPLPSAFGLYPAPGRTPRKSKRSAVVTNSEKAQLAVDSAHRRSRVAGSLNRFAPGKKSDDDMDVNESTAIEQDSKSLSSRTSRASRRSNRSQQKGGQSSINKSIQATVTSGGASRTRTAQIEVDPKTGKRRIVVDLDELPPAFQVTLRGQK